MFAYFTVGSRKGLWYHHVSQDITESNQHIMMMEICSLFSQSSRMNFPK